MSDIEKWRKLDVWLKAHKLVVEVYRITEIFPNHELYCLVSQIRRAAISIVANIVEGTKRQTSKDRVHFYVMSDTSLEELKYYFILSYNLHYIDLQKASLLTEKARTVGRMLNGLIKCQ
ncbi:MAG: S23 ribosomal protein [Candidatus Magasanikbacteria bacterium GW2011_GWC2_37_14]|uniref:S23 ribosomal protein n=1 Tax=Candidatus Magasanikbacteria bacterium GW2011_GWC2_37_14 TaxID=1619046 RepID=A0A0G0IUY3_9BACT|nr:MAG: S23 ribosomal protein [Candidatus Magasanikbacteria bacterium GW2011_GWC2_37_14]